VLFNVVATLDLGQFWPLVIALFRDGKVGDRLRERGVPARCLGLRSAFGWSGLRHGLLPLCRLIRDHRIDVVHSFLTASGIFGALAAKANGIPSLLNVHGPLSRHRARYLELFARNITDLLVAGNELTLRELRRTRVGRPEGLALIYNGTPPMAKATIRPFPTDVIRITMVANFFPEKDHLTLIKAYKTLRERYPLRLCIVAVGEGECRDQILAYIAQRGIPGIEIQPSRSDDLYSCQTDIFVLTSHSEGLPVSVTEAMSAGLPVIVSDVGAVNELVDHRQDGLLVPPRSVTALVAALEELIGDEELRRHLAANAIRKHRGRFDLGSMAAAYRTLYQSC